MIRPNRSIAMAVMIVLGLTACGGNPNSPSNFAQIAGSWTGNLQSSNWNAAAINVFLSQSTDAVTGTWASSAFDWNGTLSGTVSKTSFTGTFTISAPNALGIGARCTGTASVSGAASSSGKTLAWTSPGFTGTCTGMPINLTWNIQR